MREGGEGAPRSTHGALPPFRHVLDMLNVSPPAEAIPLSSSSLGASCFGAPPSTPSPPQVDTSEGAWLVATPRLRLDIEPNGTGDATAALFLAGLVKGKSPKDAMAHAAAAVFGLLRVTRAAGTRELQVVAAQEEFETPSASFTPRRVR